MGLGWPGPGPGSGIWDLGQGMERWLGFGQDRTGASLRSSCGALEPGRNRTGVRHSLCALPS